jgi:valyl-tRNA synthetase
MESKLPKGYEPREVEEKWYAVWEQAGFFRANENSPKPHYSIVIPPPNVTGVLHMGHALNNTLQDILCRWKRMTGHEVLWMPGTDHAGIATQNVVEKQLAGEGKDRHELGREKFIERVWQWREESGGQTLVLALTLIVTPVAYSLFDELGQKGLFARAVSRRPLRRTAAEPTAPV